MTKRFGFTLAEVLITLGIIGVVAAMTMPTLMNSTQGAQYKAAYKKALSALSQAVTLNVALDDTSFADTIKGVEGSTEAKGAKDDGSADDTKVGTTIASLLNSRMNVVRAAKKSDVTASGYTLPDEITKVKGCNETGKNPGDEGCTEKTTDLSPNTYLFFNDGIMFAFDNMSEKCTESNKCVGIVDVNGQKGPNKLTKCDSGTGTAAKPCVVSNPTDIYHVEFYDQTVLPADDAAKAVLYGK